MNEEQKPAVPGDEPTVSPADQTPQPDQVASGSRWEPDRSPEPEAGTAEPLSVHLGGDGAPAPGQPDTAGFLGATAEPIAYVPPLAASGPERSPRRRFPTGIAAAAAVGALVLGGAGGYAISTLGGDERGQFIEQRDGGFGDREGFGPGQGVPPGAPGDDGNRGSSTDQDSGADT
ncbi:MAG: hypothetical protein U0R80_17645 [Nocardioidaceae bacterium]